jgi:excisionase family DNA binding protein
MTQKPQVNSSTPDPEAPRNKSASQALTRLLKPEEAAAYLAISKKTLMRLVAQGEVRARRVSKSMRFELADLQAYVARSPW